MTLLVVAGVVGLSDWMAVARRLRRAELVLKPLTLALLLVAATSGDLGDAKPWVVAALALGLMGDIALMFSDEQAAPDALDPAFLVGLAAFLLGHVSYIVGFARHGVHPWQSVAGVLVVAGVSVLALPRVLRGARATGGSTLVGLVGVYAVALATMSALAVGTGSVATAIGGLLFLASDVTLAWSRFVQPLLRGPVIVIVTYHLAQLLIVLGLLR